MASGYATESVVTATAGRARGRGHRTPWWSRSSTTRAHTAAPPPSYAPVGWRSNTRPGARDRVPRAHRDPCTTGAGGARSVASMSRRQVATGTRTGTKPNTTPDRRTST